MEWKETQMYSARRSCIETVGHECHNVIPLESLRNNLNHLSHYRRICSSSRAEFTTSSTFHHKARSPI